MMDWQACKNSRYVKSISPDAALISSLKESSANKEASATLLPLTATTKESVITLFYDAVRELLEALAISNSLKIYNHECYTSFLAEIMKNDALSKEFDALRLLRNSINYYGGKVKEEDARVVIADAKELLEKVKWLLANHNLLNP